LCKAHVELSPPYTLAQRCARLYIGKAMEVREVLDLAIGMVDGNQAELARRLKRSETTVSRWITGRNGIDFESALRLARLTGLPARDVVDACGLDPALVPLVPEFDAHATIDARRQAVRDQLDVWLSAVGPENEGAFWDSLKAQGQATVNLIRRVGTADNAGTEAADNAAVMSRAERGRGRRNGPNGQIMSKQHAVGPALGAGRHASNHRQAA
jgi:transcriptional regulator with XRE-family HTH domain